MAEAGLFSILLIRKRRWKLCRGLWTCMPVLIRLWLNFSSKADCVAPPDAGHAAPAQMSKPRFSKCYLLLTKCFATARPMNGSNGWPPLKNPTAVSCIQRRPFPMAPGTAVSTSGAPPCAVCSEPHRNQDTFGMPIDQTKRPSECRRSSGPGRRGPLLCALQRTGIRPRSGPGHTSDANQHCSAQCHRTPGTAPGVFP
jgi:hypothetical protein